MRITLLTVLTVLCMAVLYSCSEDFTVSAPYKDITIVSGLLNEADSEHYIRIQKAFMDEHKSAIEMSKEPDSSFYNDLTVQLLEYDSTQTNVLEVIDLYRVDANKEGYQKNDPLTDQQFFNSPNYAYKFIKKDLSSRLWYKLLIKNNQTGRTDSSDFVGLVNSSSSRYLQGFYIPEFDFGDYSISFDRTAPGSRFRLFVYMPKNGRMVEGFIRFHYVEKNTATNTTRRDSVDYAFDTEIGVTKPGTSFDLVSLNTSIHQFLYTSIGPAPDNVERYMDSCDIFVYAAGPEVYYYNTINLGQATGLTGDNIQPNYTNFTGNEVIGILSSRAMRQYKEVAIEKVTIDSLVRSSYLAPLRIRGLSDD